MNDLTTEYQRLCKEHEDNPAVVAEITKSYLENIRKELDSMKNIEIHDYEDDQECVVYPYGLELNSDFAVLSDPEKTITFMRSEKITDKRLLEKPRGEWTINELRDLFK